ncbi:transposase [Paenibacillus protaetiae]|uniref:Transposase n=1 Tax=Paenibacillus protaetiae TaxID=2509456 RepID=A0A4P6EWS3_9BACL|nr:transposase [Paenibacillus protaetiae]QAY67484.1 transposase [Paenibacillus protaetiae]
MRQSLSEQQQVTIYQYRLIRRKTIRPELVQSHVFIAALFLGCLVIVYHLNGLFAWLFGFVLVQLLHMVILLLTFIRVEEAVERRWQWRITPPWFGIGPANDISLRLFRRVHRTMLWIGLCLIALLYPWANEPLMISCICWHLWLLIPRSLISISFRKESKDGVLRLHTSEASYYHR